MKTLIASSKICEGLGIFAKSDIEKGEIVLEEHPIITTENDFSTLTRHQKELQIIEQVSKLPGYLLKEYLRLLPIPHDTTDSLNKNIYSIFVNNCSHVTDLKSLFLNWNTISIINI